MFRPPWPRFAQQRKGSRSKSTKPATHVSTDSVIWQSQLRRLRERASLQFGRARDQYHRSRLRFPDRNLPATICVAPEDQRTSNHRQGRDATYSGRRKAKDARALDVIAAAIAEADGCIVVADFDKGHPAKNLDVGEVE